MKFSKILSVDLIGLFIILLSLNIPTNSRSISMFNYNEQDTCINSSDAFCKNLPAKNDGYCVVLPTKICCKTSSSQNSDCYDVGL